MNDKPFLFFKVDGNFNITLISDLTDVNFEQLMYAGIEKNPSIEMLKQRFQALIDSENRKPKTVKYYEYMLELFTNLEDHGIFDFVNLGDAPQLFLRFQFLNDDEQLMFELKHKMKTSEEIIIDV